MGAAFGSTPVIVHLESAAGLTEGGKTGLTSITASVLFAASVFFGPILDVVPEAATAPILMYVGMLMMSQARDVKWSDPVQGMPAFAALVAIPFTFSVPNGVAFGAGAAAAIRGGDWLVEVVCGRSKGGAGAGPGVFSPRPVGDPGEA